MTKKTVDKIVTQGMLSYGRYVAEDRALSDYRDGLKPVQRRILWTCWENLGLRAKGVLKRGALVASSATGLYHPHNEASAYGSVVKLVNLRYAPLVGEGNFGSNVLDLPPAAGRYTSVKGNSLLEALFVDRAIADLEPNYTGELKEPVVVPSRIPFLFANGCEGIAVAIASHIPPNNLGELIKALKYVVRNPNKAHVVSRYINGPDYAEGGKILSTPQEVKQVYDTGQGTLRFSCQWRLATSGKERQLIVESGCPHWNLTKFKQQYDSLVNDKFVKPLRNVSADGKIRIVCPAATNEVLKVKVVPLLERKLSYNFVALDDRKPVRLTFPRWCANWVTWRQETISRRVQHDMSVLAQRLEDETARLKAQQKLPAVLKALQSKNPSASLKKLLTLTDRQVKVILDSRLSTLTNAKKKTQQKLVKQLKDQRKKLKADLKKVPELLLKELDELKKLADDRRTLY